MHKFLFITSLALLSFSLQAQNYYEQIRLSINSKDGVYQPGDTVKVSARSLSDSPESILMQTISYDKVLSEKETSLSGEDQLIYCQVAAEPTSVIIKVSPASDPKAFTSIGYLVSPEAFKPGFETPSDLKAFWDAELSKMRALKPDVKILPAVGVSEKDAQEFNCFKIEINMPEGNPCRGYVAYPRNAAPGSLPIYLFLHSAGVTKPWNHDRASQVISLAKKGYLAVDINAHGMLADQPQEYYDALDAGELYKYSGRAFTSVSDYYFHNMYLRDVRGLDYVTTLPVWDGKRILVHGESQGGGQALALSGIDERITHCVAIVPALTDMGGCLDGRKSGWPGWANKKVADTPLGKSVLPYHDGALLVSLFKGKLYLEAGNADFTCDPACVSAGMNNASQAASKTIVFYPSRPHTTSAMGPLKKEWEEAVMPGRNAFFDACLSNK
ncbi:MAG: acetylxylan esterase [Bacteroidales bacterium]|nr:acetylxylan esterase [Bacteroidales bacterium]